MATRNSYYMIEFRNKITSEILKNKELVELLDSTPEKAIDDLLYQRIYPHEYIPITLKDAAKYINFDMQTSLNYINKVFTDITIYFFLLADDAVLRTSKGLWYDRVTCVLDEMFTENKILGVGTMSLQENRLYVPTNDIRGRMLTFRVRDFTDGGKYGK